MKIKTFINNLRYLTRYNIKQLYLNSRDILGFIKFEQKLYENNSSLVFYPKIKTIEETIKELIEGHKSIARFGDGEFSLLEKKSIPFQNYNEELDNRLKEILISKDENIAISIPYFYFNIININFTDTVLKFIKNDIFRVRKFILNNIDLNKSYYAKEFTHLYNFINDYNFVEYFNSIKKIWEKKDILIVTGETVFNKIQYNIFDNANTINYFKAPSKNAFNEYNNILNNIIKTTPKSTLIITILGPTATVLAYDLHRAGYRALDLGHIAKDYDFFMKKFECNDENTYNFFKPD